MIKLTQVTLKPTSVAFILISVQSKSLSPKQDVLVPVSVETSSRRDV